MIGGSTERGMFACHRALWLCLAMGVTATFSTTASADDAVTQTAQTMAVRNFDIPPQPLADALALFGEQAGIQVSANGDLVRDLTTQGIKGPLPIDQALQALLAGTNLKFELTSTGAVILDQSSLQGTPGGLIGPVVVEGLGVQDKHAGAADRANSIYVTRPEIELRNPNTIKEVFEGESSVSVGSSIAMSQKVYVHGVEENNLAVTVDGARQNNKTFHHNATNLIDPSLLKQVRVDPGVAPADAGPGALGGAIVYETVDAADLLAPGSDLGGFLSGSYETNGDTVTGQASGYGRYEGAEGLAFVKYANGNDFKDGDGDTVLGTGADLLSFLVKGAFEGNGEHRIEATAENVHDDSDRPFRANIGDIIGVENPKVRKYDLNRQNYTLRYERPFAEGLWDPNAVLGYGVTDLHVPEPFGSKAKTSSISGSLSNDFHITPRADVITAGVDFFHDRANYNDPFDDVTEHATNVGVFAQARLQPIQPLRLSFGIRGDNQWFEGLDGTDKSDFGVSGNVFAEYDVADFLTLSAGYSNVWGGFALAENFIMNPDWVYEEIVPVKSQNFIAGFESFYEGITFGANIFRSDFDNARDPLFGGDPFTTADFRTQGFDVGLGYTWGPGFIRATYTDTDIKVNGSRTDSDTTQYLGAPLGQLLAIDVVHRFDPIGLTIGANMNAAFSNSDLGGFAEQDLEPYEVFSIFAEYVPEFANFLTLRAEVNNIFDENYADRATYGQDFPEVEPLREPGRSFLFLVRAQF